MSPVARLRRASSFTLSKRLPLAQRLGLRTVESHCLGRLDALSLKRSTNPLLLFCQKPQKTRPRCSGGRARREDAVEGAEDQNTKLTPATGPLNSCFRPMVPSLPFLSASSLNQS